MIKRIMPVVVICSVLISAICFPAAASESYLEPYKDNSKESHSDTQYLYEYYKAHYNDNPYYTFRPEGGTSAHFVGNSFTYTPNTSCNIVLDMYPMGLPNYNENYVSLASFRKTGKELVSVRIPVVAALGNTGKQYSIDVDVVIKFYDSSLKLIRSVDSMELNTVTANGGWYFVDPGHIDIPYSSDAEYFSVSVNFVSYVPNTINVKWGLLELKTRRNKSDEILSGSHEDQIRGEEFQENMGNTAGDVITNNNKLESLTPNRPSLNTNIQLDNQTVNAASPLIAKMWSINGLQSQVGIVFVVAAMAYVFFGKRDG